MSTVATPVSTRVTAGTVVRRRVIGAALVLVPLGWALFRSFPPGTDLVNRGGLSLLGDLLSKVLHPSLAPDFLLVVLDASLITVVFAALGTAGALVIGVAGGVVLSDAAWHHRPPAPVRVVRLLLRALLVAVRSIHELVWALLLVSVLGLDPLVAVLAIAIPFGAQTAKVFGETLDSVPRGPLDALRGAGTHRVPALAYGLLPGATPLLLSYSFYRFECAIRSAVLLGVVGVGGLGQELVVSLQSRNWNEVWTLVGAVLLLSAVVDLWSTRIRSDMAVASCSDWAVGEQVRRGRVPLPGIGRAGRGSSRGSLWARWSGVVIAVGLVAAWVGSGVSLAGLTSDRTRALSVRLLDDMWPPALPPGGGSALLDGVLDTLAMAVLAMALAVVITLVVGPWASTPRATNDSGGAGLGPSRWFRLILWGTARTILLVLRSVPPTIWAIVALLVLFPGVAPGAVALGLYTGGILGRLVAEAWESLELRPVQVLHQAGVPRVVAAVAAMAPPSANHLLTYTLYRFEICVRDTAVVGVVGAAGLGRLLAENLAVFRFPAVTTLLLVSFAVSAATEVFGRRVRRAISA